MVLDYFPKIKDLRRQMSGYLSGGEQQMLVIGRALMARPKLMLLDEPSLGLAPLLVQEIFEIIQRINTEQNARAALGIADYGYVMENGKVVTVDEDFSIAEAVAVKGDTIVAVGTTKEIEKLIGENTKVLDLKGETMLPGINDAHAHFADIFNASGCQSAS